MKEIKKLEEAIQLAEELGLRVEVKEFESQDVRAFKEKEDFGFVEIWHTNMEGAKNIVMELVIEALKDRGLIKDLTIEWGKIEATEGHFAVVPVKIEVEER